MILGEHCIVCNHLKYQPMEVCLKHCCEHAKINGQFWYFEWYKAKQLLVHQE
jgi:hypothetical protein